MIEHGAVKPRLCMSNDVNTWGRDQRVKACSLFLIDRMLAKRQEKP